MRIRRAIEVEGLEHTNPIPVACVIGNVLVSGGIFGQDPDTGELGADLESQCRLMFDNVARVMAAANGSAGDIIKMTVWLRDGASKAALNTAWCDMFPDARSRPARHTFTDPHMAERRWIQCEIMAVLPD